MGEDEEALDVGIEARQGFQALFEVHGAAGEVADLGFVGGVAIEEQLPTPVGGNGAFPVLHVDGKDAGGADDQVVNVAVAVGEIEVTDDGVGVGELFQERDDGAFAFGAGFVDADAAELLVEVATEPAHRKNQYKYANREDHEFAVGDKETTGEFEDTEKSNGCDQDAFTAFDRAFVLVVAGYAEDVGHGGVWGGGLAALVPIRLRSGTAFSRRGLMLALPFVLSYVETPSWFPLRLKFQNGTTTGRFVSEITMQELAACGATVYSP